jgi:hypothetical protein
MKHSVKEQLFRYLRANPGSHAKGNLERMEWRTREGKLATPENIGRRLRELENEKKIQVEQRKNHDWYSVSSAHVPKRQIVQQLPDGSVRVTYQ